MSCLPRMPSIVTDLTSPSSMTTATASWPRSVAIVALAVAERCKNGLQVIVLIGLNVYLADLFDLFPRRRAAQKSGDLAGQPRVQRFRGGRIGVQVEAADMLEPSGKTGPSEIAFFFDEDGPCTAPRRSNSRCSTGNAGATTSTHDS